MKICFLAAILIFGFCCKGFAQSEGETSDQIKAEVVLTRGHIDNLIESLGRMRGNGEYNITDYESQKERFKESIIALLKKFEEGFEDDVLRPLGKLSERYNSIYVSKEFSDTQRYILLGQVSDELAKTLPIVENRYKELLKELYAFLPMPIYQVSIKEKKLRLKKEKGEQEFTVIASTNPLSGSSHTAQVKFNMKFKASYNSWARRKEHAYYIKNGKDWVFHFYDVEEKYADYLHDKVSISFQGAVDNFFHHGEVYKKIVYPQVKGSCLSSLCVSLRTADYLDYLHLLKNNLDRGIEIKLLGGKTLEIGSLYFEDSDYDHNGPWHWNLLERADYPEDLPFEI